MKKIFFPLVVTVFAAGTIFIGCESSAQKVDNAEQNVADAQAKLDQARLDSAAQYDKAKAIWSEQIVANDKKLAEYKIQIAKEKKEEKIKNEAKLDELQAKNDALKVRMTEYKQDGITKWEAFQMAYDKEVSDFEKDMTQFGESIAAIGKEK